MEMRLGSECMGSSTRRPSLVRAEADAASARYRFICHCECFSSGPSVLTNQPCSTPSSVSSAESTVLARLHVEAKSVLMACEKLSSLSPWPWPSSPSPNMSPFENTKPSLH